MKKYVVFYLLLLPVGAVISVGLSSLIHVILDMPRGVPLARLGLQGAMAQISLMIFPFIFAPIFTAIAYYGGNKSAPTKRDLRRFVATIFGLFALLWMFIIVVSGAWFGLLQGSLWFISGVVLGPPIVAMILCWFLFSTVIWMFVRVRSK
ncbi:MAG: hypothetical protein WBC68_01810 [Albidovulum sp.]